METLLPITSLRDFVEKAKPYVLQLEMFTRKYQGSEIIADHICLKCENSEVYERIRKMFERAGCPFWQSMIAERRIAYIFLPSNLIVTNVGPLRFVELADKKPSKPGVTKFDHIEVYSMSTRRPEDEATTEELIKHYKSEGEKVEYDSNHHHPTINLVQEGGFIIRRANGPLLEKIINVEIRS